MSRVGLGRHGQLDSDAGDPLDGLVNMFDLGLVLAVAFLVAGLTLSADKQSHKSAARTATTDHSTTIVWMSPRTEVKPLPFCFFENILANGHPSATSTPANADTRPAAETNRVGSSLLGLIVTCRSSRYS